MKITYDDVRAWLIDKEEDVEYGDIEIIEFIRDIIWRLEDLEN